MGLRVINTGAGKSYRCGDTAFCVDGVVRAAWSHGQAHRVFVEVKAKAWCDFYAAPEAKSHVRTVSPGSDNCRWLTVPFLHEAFARSRHDRWIFNRYMCIFIGTQSGAVVLAWVYVSDCCGVYVAHPA